MKDSDTKAKVFRRELDDATLLDTELRIADPHSLSGLSQERPDPSGDFSLLGSYRLSTKEEGLRCSYCTNHQQHWNGFVLEAGEAKYLLGSTCGPKHFDLSFGASQSALKGQEARRNLLARLWQIEKRASDIESFCRRLLFGEGLKAVLAAKKDLKSKAPDLTIRLRYANAAGGLSEQVRVRDRIAESAEDRPADAKPIYKFERRAIGSVDGAAMVEDLDLRGGIHFLKTETSAVLKTLEQGTDSLSTAALRAAVRKFEDAHADAAKSVRGCNSAHLFFAARNRSRLVRWSGDLQHEQFVELNGELAVIKKGRTLVLEKPPVLSLSKPPKVW